MFIAKYMRHASSVVLLSLAGCVVLHAADAASPADKAFIAKVSQGGMFEVEAGKVAEDKASAQDVKDLAGMEVHDHELVGAKLKSVADSMGVPFSSNFNPEFQQRLDTLKGLSGSAFDHAYLAEMIKVHNIDGGLFAQAAKTASNPQLRAFAAETSKIVDRHIGALHPKPRQ